LLRFRHVDPLVGAPERFEERRLLEADGGGNAINIAIDGRVWYEHVLGVAAISTVTGEHVALVLRTQPELADPTTGTVVECLAIYVARRITSDDVLGVLAQLFVAK